MRIESKDMETALDVDEVWLPFYAPYYQKVTSSQINDGVLSIKSQTAIRNLNWTTNAQAELRRLQFSQLESGNEIMGFDAQSILDILRNNQGNIQLSLMIRYNMNDPSMNFERALRRSLQDSIKATFLSNIHTVVSNTIEKFSKDGGTDYLKKDSDGGTPNLKELLGKVADAFD